MGDTEIVSVNTDAHEGAVLVSPNGDVDMSRSPVLRRTLHDVQARKPARMIVDLGNVDYMDSSGLATLVEAMRAAKGADTKMVLCGMNEKVRAIFEIARLHHFFTIVGSVDEAVSS